MKALVYSQYGQPDVLEWAGDWPHPVMSDNEVLIRSVAGGINPKDVLLRKGKFSRTLAREPLPRVSGHDIAGEIVEIGTSVSGLSIGDHVFGMTNHFPGGVHSEFATLRADEVALAPENTSSIEASSIPLAAQTALQALRDCCGIEAGQKVLINGASGGVGHFAVQIAKLSGAEVHAVCSSRNLDFVRSLGADVVHDYKLCPATDIALSFHLAFDVFGKLARSDFAKQLGANGIYVSTVPKFATLRGELLARLGISKRSRLVLVRSNTADLNTIREWVEAGRVKPHVERVYPVENAAEAHRHIETRHTRGKIVLSF